MSIQPELIKQSQLVDKLVLDRQSMEEIGRVERLWLDPRTHRIVGITCKAGLLGMKKLSFAWQQIYSLGNNILVNNLANYDEWQKPDISEQILNWELLTEDGNKAGKIEDYLIEPNTGEVISYLFLASDRGNILTRRFLLAPEGITNIGNKRVLARNIAVQTSEPYTEGLNLLLTQARDFIIEDKDTTIQHLDAVKSQFTNLVTQFKAEAPPKMEQVKGQVGERVQELRDQATERAQGFRDQATEKAQEFKEQAQEFREQATEKAQEFREQATEKAQEFREQATERVQEFKEQATERATELREQATEKAQSLAEGAQPMINRAKEKVQGMAEEAKERVQAIADDAKKQLEKKPELVASGDENITRTIETTAERVATDLALAEKTMAGTLGETLAIDQPTVTTDITKTTSTEESVAIDQPTVTTETTIITVTTETPTTTGENSET